MMLHVATLSQNVLDALSFVWLELVMFFAAALGYVVFAGARRAARAPAPAAGKALQIAHAQQDYRQVVQLWPRTTPDDAEACLPMVVDALQRQKRSLPAIMQVVEPALQHDEPSALNALLQDLVQRKDLDLVDALVGLLPSLPVQPDRTSYELLLAAHGVLSNFHEVLSLSARLEHAGVPFSPGMHKTALKAALQTSNPLAATKALEHLPRLDFSDTLACAQLFLKCKQPAQCWELSAVKAGIDAALVYRLLEKKTAREVLPLVERCGVAKTPALVAKLVGKGGPLDLLRELPSDLPEPLAQELLKVARDHKRPELVELVLASASSLTPPLAVRGCEAWLACGEAAKAVALYAAHAQNAQVDPALAAQLAHAATDCQESQVAAQLQAQQPKELAASLAQLRQCAKAKDAPGARKIFEQLCSLGQPSAVAGNCALDACVQAGDSAQAQALLAALQQRGLADAVSYNTLLKLHLKTGKLQRAKQVMQEMQDSGVAPTIVTYNELLNALQTKDPRGMWALVTDMAAKGMAPNSVSCSIVLKSLHAGSESALVDKALLLVDQVERADEVLLASVIEALVRVGRLDLLSLRLSQYAEQGQSLAALTAPTYGSMIKAYGKAKDVERVWALWQEMRGRHIVPTSITLGCMVDALVRNGQVHEADSLVAEMRSGDVTNKLLNTIIYSTLLKGFCQQRLPDQAMQAYQAMKAAGVSGNNVTFNTLVDAMCRVGKMPQAEAILEDMKAERVAPDVITYSTLAKGYVLSGSLDQALQCLQRMHRDGLAADEILYNALLDGCAREQRCDDAVKLLEQMQQRRVRPSNYTLSILVKLLGRSRRLQQAFDVVESAGPKFGLSPNVQVYTCLLGACLANRQAARAVELHNKMVQSGLRPDQRTYACLCRGLLQLEQKEQCVELVKCAFGLPCKGWDACKQAPGLDSRLVDEVVASLRGSRYAALGPALLRDLKR